MREGLQKDRINRSIPVCDIIGYCFDAFATYISYGLSSDILFLIKVYQLHRE